MSIRIGILGYGNLGRGVECAIKHNPDMELVGVFTRRAPESVKILTETAKVYSVDDAEKMKDQIIFRYGNNADGHGVVSIGRYFQNKEDTETV